MEVLSWAHYQLARFGQNDFHLVTLPGSGTYWVRYMLMVALVRHFQLPIELNSIRNEDLIPTFRDKQARFAFYADRNVTRIQHSHAHYSWLFGGRPVILLVRDLRAVLISHYRTYKLHKDPECEFRNFLRGHDIRRPGQRRGHTLLTLIDHLNSWSRAKRRRDDISVFQYEDFVADCPKHMSRLLALVGLPGDEMGFVEAICEAGSRPAMAEIESKAPLVQYKGRLRKVRSRTSDTYRTIFTEADNEYFISLVRNYLEDDFGYNY